LVAWEIAHQLQREGREVEFVVLVDTISFNARRTIRAIKKVLKLIESIAPKGLSERVKLNGMHSVWNWLERLSEVDRQIVRRVINRINRALRHQPVSEAQGVNYFQVMANYVPPRIEAEVICLVCE